MTASRDILVATSSTLDGIKIKKYLHPVSAHIVAGTNVFSDFFGSLTDTFGGRSNTYQKQLSSLYNEAIERIKYAAYAQGANAVVGLHVDLDEIAGKGKSMFMITAIGTAVIIEDGSRPASITSTAPAEKGFVSIEQIQAMKSKKEILDLATAGQLQLNESVWDFITMYKVQEIFPYLVMRYASTALNEAQAPGSTHAFYTAFMRYLDAMDEEVRTQLLYEAARKTDEVTAFHVLQLMKEQHMYDYNMTMSLLNSDNFDVQKRGLAVATFDKAHYNMEDVRQLEQICEHIKSHFGERGRRVVKKQMLSSNHKEMWLCGCGRTNEIQTLCKDCNSDIYGFKAGEPNPHTVTQALQEKISLLKGCFAEMSGDGE